MSDSFSLEEVGANFLLGESPEGVIVYIFSEPSAETDIFRELLSMLYGRVVHPFLWEEDLPVVMMKIRNPFLVVITASFHQEASAWLSVWNAVRHLFPDSKVVWLVPEGNELEDLLPAMRNTAVLVTGKTLVINYVIAFLNAVTQLTDERPEWSRVSESIR